MSVLAETTRALLVEKFPLCFMPKGAHKKPLKIGIYHEIRAAIGIKGRPLGAALSNYTSGPLYLRHIKEGAERIDLNGQVAGLVTADEEKAAQEKLKRFDRRPGAPKADAAAEAAR